MVGKVLTAIEKNPPLAVTSFPLRVEAIEMYRVLYRDITDNGVELQYNDRHALGELAVTMVECQSLRTEIYDKGEYLEVQGDRNMVTKKNPARDALEKIRPKLYQLMKEFKMTPASRGTKSTGGSGGNELDDEFNQM
ncbi:putative terminase small subunit [Vibrio phage 2.044.O._10N.261.51.B8]|nr:putative terminase small subunit [Vibrio phage 2.044.O._10N.261.51.B8]